MLLATELMIPIMPLHLRSNLPPSTFVGALASARFCCRSIILKLFARNAELLFYAAEFEWPLPAAGDS
jgi:hypothetical protein